MLRFLCFVFIVSVFNAQDVVGSWEGNLNVSGQKLPVVLHITKIKEAYQTKMDSPAQGSFGNNADITVFKNGVLTVEIKKFAVKILGDLKKGKLDCTFTQGMNTLPLVLEKKKSKKTSKRQIPVKPYPYNSTKVQFKNTNAGDISLAGTLTLPVNIENPPVAILISGSGPQNRDEELLGHKPFLILSDHLTRNGIAVLRYDDRGVAKSEGDFKTATTFDFVSDVEAAIKFLKTRKDIDVSKIGLIGHSEGGLIAQIVAAEREDVAFSVYLAAPGIRGKDVLLTQTKRSSELADGNEEDIALNEFYSEKIFDICIDYDGEESDNKIRTLIRELREKGSEEMKKQLTDTNIEKQIQVITSPWMRTFLGIDPTKYLEEIKTPVFALNGSKDFQVISGINLSGINQALKKANNQDFTVKEFKGLNHLFQTCNTGAMSEYALIEETISATVLNEVTRWIKKRF